MNLAGKVTTDGSGGEAPIGDGVSRTDPRTKAGRLERIQRLHEASYDRKLNPDGSVRLRLHLSVGDVIAENGKDTEEALGKLELKLRKLYPDKYPTEDE